MGLFLLFFLKKYLSVLYRGVGLFIGSWACNAMFLKSFVRDGTLGHLKGTSYGSIQGDVLPNKDWGCGCSTLPSTTSHAYAVVHCIIHSFIFFSFFSLTGQTIFNNSKGRFREEEKIHVHIVVTVLTDVAVTLSKPIYLDFFPFT